MPLSIPRFKNKRNLVVLMRLDPLFSSPLLLPDDVNFIYLANVVRLLVENDMATIAIDLK
jgi:hypothetical protein